MRRILVVDDFRHVRGAIGAWLKRCEFRVAIADGSANGLAAPDDASFDLMIVDILMTKMRGFESVRLFHQRAGGSADCDFRPRICRNRSG
ncbi:MAG: response regulator [Bradyrhizobium sp.]